MKISFFPKLAWSGITKNSKLYIPYILSCIGMIAMYYIMSGLSVSPMITKIHGGSQLAVVLSLGKYVIGAFSLLFLFYTNSFLVRRRYKEFGLYNILGMDKNAISLVIFFESLMIAFISIVGGLILGITLSKFAELGLLNSIHQKVNYSLSLSPESILITLAIFGAIFFILFIRSLLQVRRLHPIDLMKSENAGEKPIKANWFVAFIGLILLGVAYYISVTIKNPLTATMIFLFAIIIVIVATYMLFMSASVAVCKLLQKNKKYYYKKNHFISVSSMTYRMKRNGAGLASICILCCMVLGLITTTSSLYFGANDAINSQFPQQNFISVQYNSIANMNDQNTNTISGGYSRIFKDFGATPDKTIGVRYASIAGLLEDNTLKPNSDNSFEMNLYESLRTVYFISDDDYSAYTGKNIKLNDGEALLETKKTTYKNNELNIEDVNIKIVGNIEDYPEISDSVSMPTPFLLLVISDFNELSPLESLTTSIGNKMLDLRYYFGYDLNANIDTVNNVYLTCIQSIKSLDFLNFDGYNYFSGSMMLEKDDFFLTFGGLFFIGIMLSVVFGFAAAMIIYYKQVSEGYEDSARFSIMKKVGLTKEEIKKNVNSQILTVFFAPLITAGIHISFAFPMVWKLLQLFHLQNVNLVIMVFAISFLIFGILYAILYKTTAGAYLNIVSPKSKI